MKNLSKNFLIFVLGLLLVGGVAFAYDGVSKVVIEGDYIEAPETGENLGVFPGPDIYQDVTVYGTLTSKEKTTQINQTGATSTVTLLSSDSGTTYLLKATGTIIMLPSLEDGLKFTFRINGAAAIDNFQIRSAEGDNIEGTLIVAGAVVDCDAEDKINFVTDGENIGDYFEIYSDGSQWLLGDSGVLTAGKLTCTDPA